jgi:hypothetical protein
LKKPTSFVLFYNPETEKPNRIQTEKNQEKNRASRKKSIKILKNLSGLIRFRFYNPKTEKQNRTQTEKNRKKTESNQKNLAKLKKNEPKPSQTGLNRFLS